jgi:hypothetical protein
MRLQQMVCSAGCIIIFLLLMLATTWLVWFYMLSAVALPFQVIDPAYISTLGPLQHDRRIVPTP